MSPQRLRDEIRNRRDDPSIGFPHICVFTQPRPGPDSYLNVGRGSLRLDARELDQLGPLLGFVGDELAEAGQ